MRWSILLSPTKPICSVLPSSNNDRIGFFNGPWRHIKFETEPEAVFVLAKNNYKVYANIGYTISTTKRFDVVFDTEASSGFIKLHEHLEAMRRKIKKPNDMQSVRNAIGKAVPIVGKLNYLFKSVQAQGSSTLSSKRILKRPWYLFVIFVSSTWRP